MRLPCMPLPLTTGWLSYNITNVFKSIYYDNPVKMEEQGLLFVEETNNKTAWHFHSSNYSDIYKRPILKIKYSPTRFGDHIGSSQSWYNCAYTYPCSGINEASGPPGSAGSLDYRFQVSQDENMKIQRFFFSPENGPIEMNNLGLPEAKSRGMKVIWTVPLFEKAYTLTKDTSSNVTAVIENNPNDVADEIILNYLDPVASFITDGTLLGVEFTNEDDAASLKFKNTNSAISTHWAWRIYEAYLSNDSLNRLNPTALYKYEAGKNMGKFLGVVIEAIKNKYPGLQILAPAFSFHNGFSHLDDDSDPDFDGRGQDSEAFLRGIIEEILSYGDVHSLPDIISYHGYARPEDYRTEWTETKYPGIPSNDTGLRTSMWFRRLDNIRAICQEYNYFPELAQTEWGRIEPTYICEGNNPNPIHQRDYEEFYEEPYTPVYNAQPVDKLTVDSNGNYASETEDYTTRAVYSKAIDYIRRVLINATNGLFVGNTGQVLNTQPLKYDLYFFSQFSHYGWIDQTTTTDPFVDCLTPRDYTVSVKKPIRYAAEILHSLTDPKSSLPALGLRTDYFTNHYSYWLPLKYSKTDDPALPANLSYNEIFYVSVLQCGWISVNGQQKWGAIWNFHDCHYPKTPRVFFNLYPASSVRGNSPERYTYVIDDPYGPSSAEVYKIYIDWDNPSYQTAQWQKISGSQPIQKVIVDGKSTYSLDGLVDENPVFLKFSSN
jgi:hypothetical protein